MRRCCCCHRGLLEEEDDEVGGKSCTSPLAADQVGARGLLHVTIDDCNNYIQAPPVACSAHCF